MCLTAISAAYMKEWQGMNYGLIEFSEFSLNLASGPNSERNLFGWARWIKKLWKSFSIVDR